MLRTSDDIDLDSKFKNQFRILSISKVFSEVLAAYIVSYRALGIDKEFSTICMMELSRRRYLGDDFNFEYYIEQEIKKIPKLDSIDMLKITNTMNGFIKK